VIPKNSYIYLDFWRQTNLFSINPKNINLFFTQFVQKIKTNQNTIRIKNIFSFLKEMKNNTETVHKAKQESFRVLSDDLSAKQKLIDDQAHVIRSLKDQVERIEEEHSRSRADLEARLSQRDIDLRAHIAQFEANLVEGKQYFEETLADKEAEIGKLKHALASSDKTPNSDHDPSMLNDSSILLSSSMLGGSTTTTALGSKLESEGIKSMKALYEHQIGLLKDKIEMLERTCGNYKQGIKDMNRNFGFQQHADEVTSMQIFKDLVQQLQKTNVQLETERIDLQVKVSRMKEEMEAVRGEKENVAKRLVSVEQVNARLVGEKGETEATWRRQLEARQAELNAVTSELYELRAEHERVRLELDNLSHLRGEHEQLTASNQQLVQHYEQLYQQATDIVNGIIFIVFFF
jgi:chromosome segregation ATPase